MHLNLEGDELRKHARMLYDWYDSRVRWTKDTRGEESGRQGGETGARRGDSILGTRSWREVTTSCRNSAHPCTECHLHSEIWLRERSCRCIAIPLRRSRVARNILYVCTSLAPLRNDPRKTRHVSHGRYEKSRHRAEFRAHVLRVRRRELNPREFGKRDLIANAMIESWLFARLWRAVKFAETITSTIIYFNWKIVIKLKIHFLKTSQT